MLLLINIINNLLIYWYTCMTVKQILAPAIEQIDFPADFYLLPILL